MITLPEPAEYPVIPAVPLATQVNVAPATFEEIAIADELPEQMVLVSVALLTTGLG